MMPLDSFNSEKNKLLEDINAKCVDGVCTVNKPCDEFDLDDMHVTLITDYTDELNTEVNKKVFKIPADSLKLDERLFKANARGCVLGVAGYDGHQGVILGTPFLENYYAVLDADKGQLGMQMSVKSEGGIYE